MAVTAAAAVAAPEKTPVVFIRPFIRTAEGNLKSPPIEEPPSPPPLSLPPAALIPCVECGQMLRPCDKYYVLVKRCAAPNADDLDVRTTAAPIACTACARDPTKFSRCDDVLCGVTRGCAAAGFVHRPRDVRRCARCQMDYCRYHMTSDVRPDSDTDADDSGGDDDGARTAAAAADDEEPVRCDTCTATATA